MNIREKIKQRIAEAKVYGYELKITIFLLPDHHDLLRIEITGENDPRNVINSIREGKDEFNVIVTQHLSRSCIHAKTPSGWTVFEAVIWDEVDELRQRVRQLEDEAEQAMYEAKERDTLD